MIWLGEKLVINDKWVWGGWERGRNERLKDISIRKILVFVWIDGEVEMMFFWLVDKMEK